MGPKMNKKRPRLRSKWEAWQRPRFPYFHVVGPLCTTLEPKCPKGIQIVRKSVQSGPKVVPEVA